MSIEELILSHIGRHREAVGDVDAGGIPSPRHRLSLVTDGERRDSTCYVPRHRALSLA